MVVHLDPGDDLSSRGSISLITGMTSLAEGGPTVRALGQDLILGTPKVVVAGRLHGRGIEDLVDEGAC